MTDNRTTELLPCPFCGGEADISDEGIGTEPDRFWAYCTNPACFVEGTSAYQTEAEAIAAWNTRAELGSGTLTAERLEKAKACKSSEELAALAAELLAELDKGNNGECYLVHEGEKYPVELDFGFLGMMPITITVGGFRYLVEVPNGE